MPLNLASPGIVIREVDLTIGRVDPTSGSTGALVAPFSKGPVGDPQLIESENDLLQTFGQPYSIDKHYEHWMVASSYLAYGGTLSVVRADDTGLANATDDGSPSLKIKGTEHYNQLGYDENTISGASVAAKNPGIWANGIKVAVIDGHSDQTLGGITVSGLSTTTINVGAGVTQSVLDRVQAGAGGTSLLDGYLKGIITAVDTDKETINVKVVSHVDAAGTETEVDYTEGGVFEFKNVDKLGSPIGVSIHGGAPADAYASNAIALGVKTPTSVIDWFDSQDIELSSKNADGQTVKLQWDQITNRPGTSTFAASRGARFDEMHVIVIDDTGDITGNAGTILEKHLSLSKSKDGEFSAGSPSYWRKYLATNSSYIFGGSQPSGGIAAGYSDLSGGWMPDADPWDNNATDVNYAQIGNWVATLTGGKSYGGKSNYTTTGALDCGVDDIVGGLTLFENTEETDIDFVLMGSANYPKEQAQFVADKCIAVAEARKDTVAFCSPYRQAFLNDSSVGAVTVNDIDTITNNIKSFYSGRASSTYAVFDSGYKYMYDRFNNTFRYVPLNGDIAGTCARTSLEQFPWFSPAGTARGAILNAVKLAYNPGKKQRDILYSNRINPVIVSPGAGIVLFGDKTAFAKASAFDRINVRRLFIYLENAIKAAAKDQLFEFNDELTRTNFVNIVEPFLRDVQAKRGIFDFVVVCDETNNTAAVIDSNEFVADIFIKPARSINFIGLTFVATRTGVAFEEVIGSV